MKILKSIVCISVLSISSFTFSQSQQDVAATLEQMKATGMFSEEQINAAKAELMKMDKKDFDFMVTRAKEKSQDPEMKKKAMELIKSGNLRLPSSNQAK